MSDWNNLLNSINKKVIGIINSNDDSFSGDGIYKNKDNLTQLLSAAANNDIKLIDVGCVSTKPGFKDVTQEVNNGEYDDSLNYLLGLQVRFRLHKAIKQVEQIIIQELKFPSYFLKSSAQIELGT